MKKKIKILVFSVALICIIVFFTVLKAIFGNNVENEGFLYVPTNATYSQVLDSLRNNGFIKNEASFKLLSRYIGYPETVKAGRYVMEHGMSNKNILGRLKSGRQTPVNIVFTNARTFDKIISKVASSLETDSVQLLSIFNNNDSLNIYHFNTNTVMAMFIPNTYQFYWNTNARQFTDRMYKEYNVFWNEERSNRLKTINLNKIEVAIIASIVEEETNMKSERPIMAGVYINRLRKGIPLQADPTVKFAVGDFSIKRIRSEHLRYDSPYNTYRYRGLPPGPICMPSINSIDAVLNYQPSNYYYFCAKEDFSGYHNFAATLAEHQQNARRYRKALNERDIK